MAPTQLRRSLLTSGKFVIDLFGTDTVHGLVTPQTRIRCEGAEDDHRNQGGEPHARRSGEAEPGDDHDGAAACTTADLVPGAVVREAELEIEHGRATFDEVELALGR